jgi:hypothetical protein
MASIQALDASLAELSAERQALQQEKLDIALRARDEYVGLLREIGAKEAVFR